MSTKNPSTRRKGPGRRHTILTGNKMAKQLPVFFVGAKILRSFLTKTATVQHP